MMTNYHPNSTVEMQFKQGTHVYTSDDKDVGSIDRVVLDPRTGEVTGIVVRKGFLFTEDRVVPIGLIESATEDRVQLRRGEAALNNLPEYEETYYVPAGEYDYRAGKAATPVPSATPVYGYPPVGVAWWGYGGYLPVDYMPDYLEYVRKNIPEGTVALKEGARVMSHDGEHVGNVDEIFTDATTKQATHFVISQGLLFKERKLLPTNWIRDAGEDDVMLTVSTQMVNNLPEYEPQA